MAKKMTARNNNIVFFGGILVVGIAVVSGAIMFGRSDQGQIDVSAAIANSNATAEERGAKTVPRTSDNAGANLPNGGLIGKGKSEQPSPPPPAEEVEGTATSSEETADEGDESSEDTEESIPEDNAEVPNSTDTSELETPSEDNVD